MRQPDEEKFVSLPEEDQPEIFGRSKSREEIKEELRQQRREEKQARQEALRKARERAKELPKEKRPETIIFGVVLAVIVAVCAVLLGVQLSKEQANAKFERDESREIYFVDYEAVPELETDGLSGVINEAYFTKGGYICVKMTIGNGMPIDQYMVGIEVQLFHTDGDEPIATGYAKREEKNYLVPAGGFNDYTFYFAPEHILDTEADLDSIKYMITFEQVAAEEE